jgi:Flp pilus assembly protein TadD
VSPEDPKALYAEGTKALNAGQFGRAIDVFNRCMAADKNFAMCYRAMGIAYAKSGNGPKAVRYYRLYLKVDPNAKDAAAVRQLLQQYDTAQGTGP